MAGLIFEETFEALPYFPITGTAINKVRGIENCNNRDVEHGTAYDWTLKRITTPLFEGAKSCQIEVHDCGDPPDTALLVGGTQRVRSEVVIIDNVDDARFTPGGMWYSFSIFFPTVGMANDLNSDETHNQWWEDGGNDTLIRCMNGRWGFEIIPASGSGVVRYDLFGAPGASPTSSLTTFKTTFTPIPRDQWHTFVFHFIHSPNSGGLVEIWRNDILIQTLNQRNMHTTSRYPKWKIGIYKPDYTEHPGDSDQATRTFYVDNVRVGDVDAVYADMVSGAAPPPANIPPVANAGVDQTKTLPTSTATLNGSGSSDSDGTISTYAWAKISGPTGGAITSPASVSTGITGLTAGTYVYELTVTDNDGATDTDQVSILVNPIGYPVAAAGVDQEIDLPTNTATLNGTSSTDPDGTITGYAWSKVSGPACSITSPSSATTGVTGLLAGTYTFRLTVTDNDGNTDTDDVIITVNPANVAPTANAGSNQSITLPTSSVTLNGSGSADADGTIIAYEWEQVSGPNTGTITTPLTASTTVTGLIAGTYIFRLAVTDNDSVEGTDDVQVTVNPAEPPPPGNDPPVANAGSNQSVTGTTVTLSGSGGDTDGTVDSFEWSLVSGPNTPVIVSPSSESTEVTGLIPGVYVFSLAVTDNDSDTATDEITITVSGAYIPSNWHQSIINRVSCC
jgi:hypothetical protein